MRKLWQERRAEGRKAIEKEGVEVIEDLEKELFIKAMKPFYERFITSEVLRDLVHRIQAIQ